MIPSPPLAAIFGFAGTALTEAERGFFKRVRPVGYILFARNIDTPAQVKTLVADLRGLVPAHDPLVLIDQEGGRVQRLKPPAWRFSPPKAPFGELHGRDPARAAELLRLDMRLIGQELFDLGIDVDCAPVMDVPVAGAHDVIGDRAFSHDPHVVAELAEHACEGLIDAGVVPVIKHIPGHGRARADSHKELPVVDVALDELRATDFVPFRSRCARQPWDFAMTAHVVYRAIDPARPATTSPKVIADIIRGEIGFKGLLMSDDLGMHALSGPFDERAGASLAAGCDVVLHCDGNMADMEAVARGAAPLSAQGQAALDAVVNIRRKPRRKVEHAAAAHTLILEALRHA